MRRCPDGCTNGPRRPLLRKHARRALVAMAERVAIAAAVPVPAPLLAAAAGATSIPGAGSDASRSLAATTATLISLHTAAAESEASVPSALATSASTSAVRRGSNGGEAAAWTGGQGGHGGTATAQLARYSVFHAPKLAALVLTVLRGRLFAAGEPMAGPGAGGASVGDVSAPVVAAAGVARAVCGAVIRTACQHANLPTSDAPPSHFHDAAEMLAIAMHQWPVTADDKQAVVDGQHATVPYRRLRQRWADRDGEDAASVAAGPLTHPLPLSSWQDWLQATAAATVGPHTAPLPRHLFGPLAFAAPWKAAAGRRPATRAWGAPASTPGKTAPSNALR